MKRAVGIIVILAASACSSSSGKTVTQTGRTIQYVPCNNDPPAVAGATVTVGSRSVTTAKDGTYSIEVPADEPFSMQVTKTSDPTYVRLIEADDTASTNYNRGDTKLIDTPTATLLSSALPNYDATKALLTLELVKTGSCTDLGGTTITVTPSNADALVQYPASCITPVGTNAYVTEGIFPSAVVYNLAPGKPTVTATSPKCTQIPFPYTDPTTGLTYDGTVTTEGGQGTSFLRVFMK
ncbi:MAG TPA: hypothetical protein VGI39_03745 [Polyangiaceae bacterium]|jgi:hypothetical protein